MRAGSRAGFPSAILLLGAIAVSGRAQASGEAVSATLRVAEIGFDARLRVRVYHDPAFFHVPSSAGYLFLVAADSAAGKDAFFIPTDLAFEVGASRVYPVEFEQASDLFGQALGGRLRPGEAQVGFVLVPPPAGLDRYLPAAPESVIVRYAHHRARLAPASAEEAQEWKSAVPPELLGRGLTAWWEWLAAAEAAPPMNEGDRRFLAERVFPGEGHLLEEEGMSAEGLRNAILRVGERRLLEAHTTQRVAPVYPAAVRQAGVGGLVVALCYITPEGTVGDAQVLASNTAHLLNLAALTAVMEWRFAGTRGPQGEPQDGWRMLPFQFRLAGAARRDSSGVTVPAGSGGEGYAPPQIVKAVKPDFPFEAKRRNVKGTVVYRVMIDAQGRMVEAVLEKGLDPLVDQAALEAIERTRFLPATRGGKPVEDELRMLFTFDPLR